MYISVVSYTVNGRTYELNGPAYTNRERIGTQKIVFYNPNNPAESLMEEHVSDTWYMLFIMALPMVLTGGIFLFVYKAVFSKGKKSEGIYEESLLEESRKNEPFGKENKNVMEALEETPEGKTRLRMKGWDGFAFAERTLLFQKVGTAICYVYSTNDPRVSDQRCNYGSDFYVDTALLERAEAEAPMTVYENIDAFDLRPLEIPSSEFENAAVYALKKMLR